MCILNKINILTSNVRNFLILIGITKPKEYEYIKLEDLELAHPIVYVKYERLKKLSKIDPRRVFVKFSRKMLADIMPSKTYIKIKKVGHKKYSVIDGNCRVFLLKEFYRGSTKVECGIYN